MNAFRKVLRSIYLKIFFLWVTLFVPSFAFAQSDNVNMSIDTLMTLILVTMGITIIILVIVIFGLRSVKRSLAAEERKRKVELGLAEEVEEPSSWENLMSKLTRAVPVEKERDIMLEHNYDGIRELDNYLPPWWTWLFNITIVFGVVYLLIYHVFSVAPLSIEEYENEMAEAAAEAQARQASLVASGEAFDESTIEFTDDPAVLASGEEIFKRQCIACHMADGGGGIGPNLTDQYWLHGGSMADIYNTIKVGVPDKGMISWEPLLSPQQMRDVAAYVVSLRGTTPENPKEPQGDLFEGDI